MFVPVLRMLISTNDHFAFFVHQTPLRVNMADEVDLEMWTVVDVNAPPPENNPPGKSYEKKFKSKGLKKWLICNIIPNFDIEL